MNLKSINFQSGAALITALVVVFVIAILGTAIGLQVVSLSKNSTSNYDKTISFANADSAVAEGGATLLIDAYTSAGVPTTVVDEYISDTWWTVDSNWSSDGVEVTNSGSSIQGTPTYIIEDLGVAESSLDMAASASSLPERHFYRVTGKANGKGDASTFIQATYAIWE
jgi:Tfp pilus assembly protein PilX